MDIHLSNYDAAAILLNKTEVYLLRDGLVIYLELKVKYKGVVKIGFIRLFIYSIINICNSFIPYIIFN